MSVPFPFLLCRGNYVYWYTQVFHKPDMTGFVQKWRRFISSLWGLCRRYGYFRVRIFQMYRNACVVMIVVKKIENFSFALLFFGIFYIFHDFRKLWQDKRTNNAKNISIRFHKMKMLNWSRKGYLIRNNKKGVNVSYVVTKTKPS